MTRSLLVLSALAALLAACGKPAAPAPTPTPTPSPTATATPAPTPTPTPEPTPTPVDTSAQVSVLGYHRFEARPRDPLAMTPEHFRRQMQAIKDAGVPVIPMADYLAWRRGEKAIPPRAIVITVDDGYDDAYTIAWPILKEFGYPWTFYVYLNYIEAGGRSISWAELKEMADAGVDIASHTVSHDNLVKPKRAGGVPYDEWLWNELRGSKDEIERQLGTKVTTLAYPFGVHNDAVAAKALEAGYEAAFTVNGQKALHGAPAGKIGRYIVQSDKEFTFANALKFGAGGGAAPSAAVAASNPAAATMLTVPAQGETIGDPRPELKINLATLGPIDPKTVEMRVSGLGPVPATYDPASQNLSYKLHTRLREPEVTVLVTARAGGKRVATNWTFRFDPNAPTPTPAPPTPAPVEPALPGESEAGIPAMKPAE